MLIGYARVSTEDQKLHLQHDALSTGGCNKTFDEKVSGAGTRLPGRDELLDYCLELAAQGDDGALAACMGLYLGMRPGEVLARVVRDVDRYADGVRLWIDSGKTENAQRWLEVPEPMASLLTWWVEGKAPSAPLFPGRGIAIRTDRWLRRRLEGLCDAAGVPRVCPHALRGTHSTLARQGGASGRVVADQLGHGSERITEQHYLAPGTKRRAEQKGFKLVAGGKK